MINATIEPAVFAPPFGTPTKKLLYDYVTTLLHWTGVQGNAYARLFVTRGTTEALVLSDAYPFRPWLKELLLRSATIEYDANTVARLAEMLLEKSLELEGVTGVSDLLIESIQIDPDIFAGYSSNLLRAEGEKAAIILGVLRNYSKDPSFLNFFLVSKSGRIERLAKVRCLLPLVEHSRDDLLNLPVPPKFFEGGVAICQTLDDCILSLDEVELWRRAVDVNDLETAIRVAVFKGRRLSSGVVEWAALPAFRINAGFLASARTCDALSNQVLASSTLRSIVETIEGHKLADTHALRCGSGPSQPQKTRGADRAMRRDIDRQFHLHYWESPNGVREIACVVPHNNFDICA